MKELFYYSIFAIILYYILNSVFDKLNLDKETFTPSTTISDSSIVKLATIAQNLLNGNGTFVNPGNLQIGTSSSAPGNLTVTGTSTLSSTTIDANQPIRLASAKANSNFILQNDTDSYFRLKDNSGGQLLAMGQAGDMWTKGNGLILDSGKNLTIAGSLTTNGSLVMSIDRWHQTTDGVNRFAFLANIGSFYGSGNGMHVFRTGALGGYPDSMIVSSESIKLNSPVIASGNTSILGSLTVDGNSTVKGNLYSTKFDVGGGGVSTTGDILAQGGYLGYDGASVQPAKFPFGIRAGTNTNAQTIKTWGAIESNSLTVGPGSIQFNGPVTAGAALSVGTNLTVGGNLNVTGTISGTVSQTAARFKLKTMNGWYLYANSASEIASIAYKDGYEDKYYWYWVGSRLFNAAYGTCFTLNDVHNGIVFLSAFAQKNVLQYFKELKNGQLVPHVFKGQDNISNSNLYIDGHFGPLRIFEGGWKDAQDGIMGKFYKS
jgi:hypothetical protein